MLRASLRGYQVSEEVSTDTHEYKPIGTPPPTFKLLTLKAPNARLSRFFQRWFRRRRQAHRDFSTKESVDANTSSFRVAQNRHCLGVDPLL